MLLTVLKNTNLFIDDYPLTLTSFVDWLCSFRGCVLAHYVVGV